MLGASVLTGSSLCVCPLLSSLPRTLGVATGVRAPLESRVTPPNLIIPAKSLLPHQGAPRASGDVNLGGPMCPTMVTPPVRRLPTRPADGAAPTVSCYPSYWGYFSRSCLPAAGPAVVPRACQGRLRAAGALGARPCKGGASPSREPSWNRVRTQVTKGTWRSRLAGGGARCLPWAPLSLQPRACHSGQS